MNERPTFSPLWHRVRALKPRLRPHVQITRQHYRGRRWHVVHDPASNQFYRLSPVAHEMVGLLDGERTVEEVWNIALSNHGDAAPTQSEVIELLGQMYGSNLLSIDSTPETEQLLSRGRERLKRRITQQALGIMYFRVRLFNPDRYLTWIEPILRPLINKWGFLLWCAWVVWGGWAAFSQPDALKEAFKLAIAPSQWLSIFIVFTIIKAIHETGHGVICKRYGGQVPEFGIMLLVLLPAPYVDASACWAFPSKWKRIAVGAGGMIFELAVAAAAAHVWASTLASGSDFVNRIAFNIMLTAGVTTLLFNANPLMRFDGYYILSDLLEVPNLMQRSMKMLQYLAQKHIYRVENVRPPSSSPSERATLLIYGVAAMAYRVFLFISITLYVMGLAFAIGLILAVWSAAAWFLIPLGKFVHWLATGPQLAEHRFRSVATTLALFAAGAILLGVVPFPDRRRATGVVESRTPLGVYFESDGFVTVAHARAGDRVREGDPIVTCESVSLRTALTRETAKLAEFESHERLYMKQSPAAAEIVRERLTAQLELVRRLGERVEGLVVKAPHDGVVVLGVDGVDPADIVGAYVRRGQRLCSIVDPERVRVAVPLTTSQASPIKAAGPERTRVELRRLADPQHVIQAGEARILDAGQRLLPHPALGYAGGGTIETDPQDQAGLVAKDSRFMAYVEADGLGLPGERVVVRFTLPMRPLLHQWIERLHRMMQGRTDI